MLPTGDVGDWCAEIHQVWWSLALQTTVDSRAELVVDSLRHIQPVQFVMQQLRQSVVVLSRVADDTSSGFQDSLELVGEGLGCTGENSVAVVHTRCYEGVD